MGVHVAISKDAPVPEVLAHVDEWFDREPNFLANLSNCTAFLREHLEGLDWVGWYFAESIGGDLTLGPFQGRPVATRVEWTRGVVGSAAFERAVQIVGDVKRFRGYSGEVPGIRSEIAVPLLRRGAALAVLHAKSSALDRFGLPESELLCGIARIVENRFEGATDPVSRLSVPRRETGNP